MRQSRDFIRIGVITGAHGINGRLKILIITDIQDRFKPERTIFLFQNGNFNQYIIKEFKLHKPKIGLLMLDGIDSRNKVDELKGTELFIPAEEAEEYRKNLDENTFYFFDIIGCTVYLRDSLFGEVVNILEAGSGEILVIKDKNEKEHMIPFVESMVGTSKILEKRIDIYPVEGLLDF